MKKGNLDWSSLKTRFMGTIILGLVLMVCILASVYIHSTQVIRQRINEHLVSSFRMANHYVSFRLDKSMSIARVLANSTYLEQIRVYYLLEDRMGQDLGEALTGLARDIMYLSELNEEIHSIFLYMEKENLLFDSNRNIFRSDVIRDIPWIKEIQFSNLVTWIEIQEDYLTREQLISMVYRADQMNIQIRNPVYVMINFQVMEFHQFLDDIAVTQDSQVALFNITDNLLILDSAPSDRTQVRINTVGRNLEDLQNPQREIWIDTAEHGRSLLRYDILPSIQGGLIQIIPQTDLQPFNPGTFPLVILLSVLLFALYILLFYRVTVRFIDIPVRKLIHHMKKVEQGDFNSQIEEVRKDEFGQVYQAYNQMIQKVDTLIQELYQEKLVKRELELKVLQDKINPHFLYNTLDTINWIAREHHVEEISKMVISLSTMYRITFNRGRDLISIRDVLESIRCYLDIQRIRYGDSFRYSIHAEESILDLQILNLIIQTVVENTIVHGFSVLRENGLMTLSITRVNDLLHISVRDNGKGMSEEKLRLIRAVMDAEIHENESGLRNVQKRIRLYYGEDYGVTIHSRENMETEVTIVIPIREKDGNGAEDF